MEALVMTESPQPPLTNQSSEDDIVNAVVQNAHDLAASKIAVENAVVSHCAKIVGSEALRLLMVNVTEDREEQKLIDIHTAATDQNRWVEMNCLINPRSPKISSYRCVAWAVWGFAIATPAVIEGRVTTRSSFLSHHRRHLDLYKSAKSKYPDLFDGIASDDYNGLVAAFEKTPFDYDNLTQALRVLEDPKVAAAKAALSAEKKKSQKKSIISAAQTLSPIIRQVGGWWWVGGGWWVITSVIIYIYTSHPSHGSRQR
jgi:hypothetical protein